jgi:hypothetical protein
LRRQTFVATQTVSDKDLLREFEANLKETLYRRDEARAREQADPKFPWEVCAYWDIRVETINGHIKRLSASIAQ